MSFTLGDKTAAQLGLRLLEDVDDPILPATRDYTMEVPGRHGLYDFGSDLKEKQFNLPVMFVADGTDYDEPSEQMLQHYVRQLAAHLVDAYGRPKTMKFIFHREPDKYYMVRYSGTLSIDRILRQSVGEFTLPLTAYDPYAYANANAYDPVENYYYGKVDADNNDLYYENPKTIEWKYQRHYSGVNNYSAINTDFIIEISGSVINPSITNLATGENLTLPDMRNNKIKINSRTYSIEVDGKSTLKGTNGNFFSIQPGEDGFLFQGIDPSAVITYKWLHKFL